MRPLRKILPLPLLAPLAPLVLLCCASSGDWEEERAGRSATAIARDLGLVDLREDPPAIQIELRYGSYRNGGNQILYPPDMPCLVRPGVARKLAVAQSYLAGHGLGLKIWDAYRPPEVQVRLWELSGRQGDYVGDPRKGWSMHCCGVAVDLTLVDAMGRELRMPTDFDYFGPAAHAIYSGPDRRIRDRMVLLHRAMEHAGMQIYHKEWWHFFDPDYLPLGERDVVFGRTLGLELPIPRPLSNPLPGSDV